MRDDKDLIIIQANWSRRFSVDLEQLELVPEFRSILETLRSSLDIDDSDLIGLAIREYIANKIRDDLFPHKTPGTTGPGMISDIKVKIEVANA